jgi:hypothetical protein
MEDLADWNAILMCLFLWVAALGVVRYQSRPIDILACILHDITGRLGTKRVSYIQRRRRRMKVHVL